MGADRAIEGRPACCRSYFTQGRAVSVARQRNMLAARVAAAAVRRITSECRDGIDAGPHDDCGAMPWRQVLPGRTSAIATFPTLVAQPQPSHGKAPPPPARCVGDAVRLRGRRVACHPCGRPDLLIDAGRICRRLGGHSPCCQRRQRRHHLICPVVLRHRRPPSPMPLTPATRRLRRRWCRGRSTRTSTSANAATRSPARIGRWVSCVVGCGRHRISALRPLPHVKGVSSDECGGAWWQAGDTSGSPSRHRPRRRIAGHR